LVREIEAAWFGTTGVGEARTNSHAPPSPSEALHEVVVLDALDEDVHQAPLAHAIGLEEDTILQTQLHLGIILTLTQHGPLVQVDDEHVALALIV
jgi:hypothetical protein